MVTFDGDPSWPEPDALWATMAGTATTCGGVGAGYLVAGLKAGRRPGAGHDLAKLRTLGSTGSPLPAAAARWVYDAVAPDVLLASLSGGTDVCTGFVGGSPLHPVWAGEISCRCLGAAVEVFDDAGRSIVDDEGELVLTAPLPSMPVGFWGDADGSRYHAAYFERFPEVWAHGDRATLTARGTCIITGRSDGTLNRGGVRIGTAEFYDVVEGFDDIADSLVVHVEDPGGGPGQVWLFVVVAGAATAPAGPDELEGRLRQALRRELSPRHVPDRIVVIPQVPRTLSGKKLEVPVKRILSGVPVAEALTVASVANPESLEPFVALAGDRTDPAGRGLTASQGLTAGQRPSEAMRSSSGTASASRACSSGVKSWRRAARKASRRVRVSASSASPAGDTATRATRRSEASTRRSTRPCSSSRAAIRVIDGGAIRSMAASSPSDTSPCLAMVDSAEICDAVTSPAVCWRKRRESRNTTSRS